MHVMNNISDLLETNNIYCYLFQSFVNALINEELNYIGYKYEKIKNYNNFITFIDDDLKNINKMININKITNILLKDEKVIFYFQNPFGEKIKYEFYIKSIKMELNKEQVNVFCFKNDYLKNDPFNINKNKALIEI